jgi:hypothetical protein
MNWNARPFKRILDAGCYQYNEIEHPEKEKGHATSMARIFRRRNYCELSDTRVIMHMFAAARVVVMPKQKSQIENMQPQSRVPSDIGSWKAAGIVDAGMMNTPTHKTTKITG